MITNRFIVALLPVFSLGCGSIDSSNSETKEAESPKIVTNSTATSTSSNPSVSKRPGADGSLLANGTYELVAASGESESLNFDYKIGRGSAKMVVEYQPATDKYRITRSGVVWMSAPGYSGGWSGCDGNLVIDVALNPRDSEVLDTTLINDTCINGAAGGGASFEINYEYYYNNFLKDELIRVVIATVGYDVFTYTYVHRRIN